MKNTAIIIPTRLGAKRFPNKPLAKINNLPMIIHVLNRAIESKVGEVYVATPDKEIFELVKKNGGEPILTKYEHLSGSDRVHEAYLKKIKNKADVIINLQGDMPNIKPDSILKLDKFMRSNKCDIGTLACEMNNNNEIFDPNIVKVSLDHVLENNSFLEAKDFFRSKKDLNSEKIYHHCGVYSFTEIALARYVKLPRSQLEKERNLEQMRALENKMKIHVGYTTSAPLSVDTKADLEEVKRIMEK
jgi:3-deoxy-manno-octulosonate cytidylyltransferase (CMP-KDO synthetase)